MLSLNHQGDWERALLVRQGMLNRTYEFYSFTQYFLLITLTAEKEEDTLEMGPEGS